MTNQEIFELLAENEEKLFHAWSREPRNEILKKAHEAAKKALEEFAKLTGCHN